MTRHFYIIERNGTITELEYTKEKYEATFKEWISGGRLIVVPKGHTLPTGINAVDVTKIADDEAYDTYIRTANPKQYIKNGVWYDTKTGHEVACERYVQLERSKAKALKPAPEEYIPPSPEMQKKIDVIRKKINDRFSNNK